MKIDDAIAHHKRTESCNRENPDPSYSKEHRQLAAWLTELRGLRRDKHALLNSMHKLSSYHRLAMKREPEISCFYCCKKFDPKEIKQWLDKGQTAICPLCGIDAVLPLSLELGLLKNMKNKWFAISRKKR